MTASFVRPLGSADWRPTKGNDHSCYTLNDKVLVDCNAGCLMHILSLDKDPTEFSHIFFTHMHSDHCMGLASILHHWRVVKGDLGDLTIVGPAETVRDQVMLTLQYVFHDSKDMMKDIKRLPNIVALAGEGTYETDDFTVAHTAADHAVPDIAYVFTDNETGKKIGFSGDTMYLPKFADFFRNVDLLVYECSYGGGPLDDNVVNCRHSSSREAAQVTNECGAKALMLTHCYEPKREHAIIEAGKRTDIPVMWALPFKKVEY